MKRLHRVDWMVVIASLVFAVSCSGGGCGGCGGCAGMTPLAGGFPPDKAVENAASVRVSRPGLDFLEKELPAIAAQLTNAPNGTLGFDIPKVDPPKTEIANGRTRAWPKWSTHLPCSTANAASASTKTAETVPASP